MNKYFLVFLAILISFSIWFLRFLQVQQTIPQDKQVQIVKVLEEEPKISGASQYFRLGAVQIKARSFPRFHYGDRLKIVGKVEKGGFVNYPQIEVLEKEKGNAIYAKIYALRAYLTSKINQSFGEPYASLLAGVLLGVDQLPYDFKKALTDTGTIHVVVVSGQNITIIAGFVMAMAGFIKRRLAIYLTAAVILFYTVLAGAEAPVIRAAIMGIFTYSAQAFGRGYWPAFALMLTAVLMLFYNPLYLFSLSFQLSFAATLGIVTLVPQISKFLTKLPRFLAESLAVSTSAFVLTLPIIAYSFGRVSTISIFANLGIYYLILPLMALGFIVLFLTVGIPFLGKIFGFFLFVPAFVFVYLVSLFAKVPQSVILLPKFSSLWVFAYYLLIFGLYIWILKVKVEKS